MCRASTSSLFTVAKTWMAGPSPAMTEIAINRPSSTDTASPPRRLSRASFAQTSNPPRSEGAGNAGCQAHPQPRMRKSKAYELVTTGQPNDPAFPAQWAYGFLRALSGDRAFLSPWVTTLARCTGCQRRGIKTTRLRRPRFATRQLAKPQPSHPAPNVRDDRDTPLLIGCETGGACRDDLPVAQSGNIRRMDWTRRTNHADLIGLGEYCNAPHHWRSLAADVHNQVFTKTQPIGFARKPEVSSIFWSSRPISALQIRVNDGCEDHDLPDLNLDPLDAGPLTLASVYRQVFPPSPTGRGAPLVSPDARCIAYTSDYPTTLRVGRLDAETLGTSYDVGLGQFAWGPNSEFLWTAIQDKQWLQTGDGYSRRYATSPLQPVRAGLDGRVDLLPPLSHEAGSLDALIWAGNGGLAGAEFGTRGNAYRPTHNDPNPTFAIVDTARGHVLDTLPFDEAWQNRLTNLKNRVDQADAAVLPDRRVRLLFRIGLQWIVWTQGQAPKVLPAPYARETTNLSLSPDGSRILIGRHLRTNGWVHIRGRGTIPGEPNEGVLVAMYDIETGQELWTIRATAVRDFHFPVPAISPDGRMALVGLMPLEEIPAIGLVSMQDGRIIQRLAAPGPSYSMGFVQGGRSVWTHYFGVTALYELRATGE